MTGQVMYSSLLRELVRTVILQFAGTSKRADASGMTVHTPMVRDVITCFLNSQSHLQCSTRRGRGGRGGGRGGGGRGRGRGLKSNNTDTNTVLVIMKVFSLRTYRVGPANPCPWSATSRGTSKPWVYGVPEGPERGWDQQTQQRLATGKET